MIRNSIYLIQKTRMSNTVSTPSNGKFIWFIHLFLIFFNLSPGFSQNRLSLPKALHEALDNRKNIASGRLDLTIRRLQTEALFRKYWPQISFEYVYQFNPILQTSILPIGVFNPTYPIGATQAVKFGTKWSQNAGITLVQPLLDLSIDRQIQESKQQEKISRSSEEQAEYQLAYDVATAYQNIGLQETQVQIAIADSLRTYISLELQKNRYESKKLLKSDLNTAEINHDNAVQKWKDAISQLIENKVFILYLTGQNNLSATDFKIDSNFFNIDKILSQDLPLQQDSIPEIQGLSNQERLAQLQIRSEKAKYLPNISLKGFLGANQFTNQFNPIETGTWFGNSYIGLDIKLPILNGEDKSKTIQEYRFQSEQYKNQREDKIASYNRDALTARIRLLRIKDQLKNFEKTIKLSLESLKIIQNRVEDGIETVSNLNTREADLQQLEANYTLAKKQAFGFWLDYLKASGQIHILWKE